MAIGDSITAGTFLRGIQQNPFEDITEWRGQSYAAGMDDGAITIPNVGSPHDIPSRDLTPLRAAHQAL